MSREINRAGSQFTLNHLVQSLAPTTTNFAKIFEKGVHLGNIMGTIQKVVSQSPFMILIGKVTSTSFQPVRLLLKCECYRNLMLNLS